MFAVARVLVAAALLLRAGGAYAAGLEQRSEPSAAVSPTTPEIQPTLSPRDTGAQPVAQAPVRVYMRTDAEPLGFSARPKHAARSATWCVAPCDAGFVPGDYELKLNGVFVGQAVSLRKTGTLRGEFHSHAGARAGAWLGLNVGGIVGGVFLTVAALGGPGWSTLAGGGSLVAGGAIFLLSYRADRATVSFTPGEPADVRGMPATQGPSAGGEATYFSDRATFGSQARGFGLRLTF